uniref:Transmembrane protein 159 n=1 Tax=Gasterosteus aculeatus aculeatus TaxID=481459 RepID=A0AAQ4PYU3_GASAC
MQQVSQKSGPDFQRLWGRWAGLFKPIYGDSRVTRNFICQSENLPLLCVRVCVFLSIIVWESLLQVEQLMDTRAGQYLSSHPFLALNVLLFGAAAALPVGLFLSFALVTLVMSAVVFLLFAGGLTLLSVLPGIALFSVSASVIFNALYVTTYNIFSRYFPHLTKVIIM